MERLARRCADADPVARGDLVYPSPIPIGYPLEVFTVYSKTGGISFTRECVPNAKKVAAEIAARVD
jgi:hypothetical protein